MRPFEVQLDEGGTWAGLEVRVRVMMRVRTTAMVRSLRRQNPWYPGDDHAPGIVIPLEGQG
jgi:hypothetical protein